MTVKLGVLPRVRKSTRISDVAPDGPVLIPNSSVENMKRAILERIFFVKGDSGFERPIQPDATHFQSELLQFTKRIHRYAHRSTPLTRTQFVEKFQGRKRRVYEDAHYRVLTTGFGRGHSGVRIFVKCEKTLKWDFAPRAISPRYPEFNTELGVFLKHTEHDVYRAIDLVFGEKTVLKGLTAKGVGSALAQKWHSFKDPIAVGLDAERFDQHVSTTALRWEHSIYPLFILGEANRKRLRWLLNMQLVNRGAAYLYDGKVRYKVDGTRASGDNNTGMGNCLITCGMVWSYARSLGITVKLGNNGDDCVVFMERRDYARFVSGLKEWFAKMGFRMKVEAPCYNLEEVEFCQTHPIWTPEGWLAVRTVKRALMKDSTCIDPLSTPKALYRWIMAVGLGGLALTGGIPILQEFYQMYVRSAKGYKPSRISNEGGFVNFARGVDRRYGPVHPRTRHSFYLAFGITPDMQVAVESHYASVSVKHRYDNVGCVPMADWLG